MVYFVKGVLVLKRDSEVCFSVELKHIQVSIKIALTGETYTLQCTRPERVSPAKVTDLLPLSGGSGIGARVAI